MPGQFRVARVAVDRADDQEHEGHETDGIDAIGQCRHVGAAGAPREPARLPGIEEIPEDHRQGDRGQDLFGDLRRGETADDRPEQDDQHDLQEVVDEETEEAVQVAAAEEWWGNHERLAYAAHRKRSLEKPTSLAPPNEPSRWVGDSRLARQ
ncbi:hypothetical protein [Thiocystis violascens]|uniref:hypothetical protein n=1 Tax=Thiocystis violascens TaxID=73141 RepID=UPI00059BA9F4|nr:hypothetical protein [Thiocystis violascens]